MEQSEKFKTAALAFLLSTLEEQLTEDAKENPDIAEAILMGEAALKGIDYKPRNEN